MDKEEEEEEDNDDDDGDNRMYKEEEDVNDNNKKEEEDEDAKDKYAPSLSLPPRLTLQCTGSRVQFLHWCIQLM